MLDRRLSEGLPSGDDENAGESGRGTKRESVGLYANPEVREEVERGDGVSRENEDRVSTATTAGGTDIFRVRGCAASRWDKRNGRKVNCEALSDLSSMLVRAPSMKIVRADGRGGSTAVSSPAT